jgi:hypothetical protein
VDTLTAERGKTWADARRGAAGRFLNNIGVAPFFREPVATFRK